MKDLLALLIGDENLEEAANEYWRWWESDLFVSLSLF